MKFHRKHGHDDDDDSLLGQKRDYSNVIITRHRSGGRHCAGQHFVVYLTASLFALVLLVGAYCFKSGDGDPHQFHGKIIGEPYNLSEIASNSLSPILPSGKWISDTEFLHVAKCSDESDCELAVIITDATLSKDHIILKQSKNHSHPIDLSSDRKFLITSSNRESLFRFSSTADYFYVNLTTGEANPIDPSEQHDIRFAVFGPRGTQIAYVRSGDLYYRESLRHNDSITLNHLPSGPGSGVFIWNGVPDWMYEEEILKSDRSIWFNPSGSKLAFLSIDASAVPTSTVTQVGDTPVEESRHMTFTYPRPGEAIPVASLWIADLDSDDYEVVRMPSPCDRTGDGCYLTSAVWLDDRRILLSWINRNQTKASLMLCTLSSGFHQMQQYSSDQTRRACRYILQEEANDMWTDPIIPVPSSEGTEVAAMQQDEYTDAHEVVVLDLMGNHYAVSGSELDVTRVHAFTAGYVYFEAVPEEFPRSKHVYQARSRGQDVRCLTCHMEGCSYNEAVFSPDASFFLHKCLGPAFPAAQIIDVTTGLPKAAFGGNHQLRQRLSKATNVTSRLLEIPVTDSWNASLQLYFSANSDSSAKRPLLLSIYNAPETVAVTDRHVTMQDPFGIAMSQTEHFIFAKMDVRGSGSQGLSRLKEIYGKLGDVEVNDILTVVRNLKQHLPEFDGTRVAIYGISYGGYATLRSLMKDNDSLISCGMAIAPVVDWRLYDAFYSEKYLSSLTSHPDAYHRSSVLEHVDQLRGKRFLLAHGTSDDNVHVENSMKLVKKLVDNGIEHTFVMLPDEVHYLRNPNMKLHLLKSMHKFLKHECFHEEHQSHSSHHHH